MKKNGFIAGVVFTAAAAGAAYIAYTLFKKKEQEKAEDAAFYTDPDNICGGCDRDTCEGCTAFAEDEEDGTEEDDSQSEQPQYETVTVNVTESKIRKAAEKVEATAKEVGDGLADMACKAVEEIKKIVKETAPATESKKGKASVAEPEAPSSGDECAANEEQSDAEQVKDEHEAPEEKASEPESKDNTL